MLVAYPEKEHGSTAVFETSMVNPGERVCFILHIYKDTDPQDGIPVVFTVQVNNKMYLMFAVDGTVIFREGDLPINIGGTKSGHIFYQTIFSHGFSPAFKFESSLQEGLYLAFKDDGSLCLTKMEKDTVHEKCKMLFSKN
ncbi:interleukin-18-like [Ambystoma mexicanum]|uniref:interleukin-18-like n=1 Tax=Ambystoma mexicanum TaxID=8296 RepID=UPI0037E75C1F